MASIEHSLVTKIIRTWPPDRWCDVPTLVAVSGGPDSVALLHALVRLRNRHTLATGNLVIAHVDHGVRADASAGDARFVEKLAKQLDVPCELFGPERPHDGGPMHSKPQHHCEDSLRAHRYRCLNLAAQKHGARYLATAHTLDDQVETVLFRILRGTGIRGLTGIPTFRSLSDGLTLVRPMLEVSKTEVHDFLAAQDVDFRVDDSNADSNYTRNFLRNDLLPLARQRFPDVDRAIANLCQHATDQQSATQKWVAAARRAMVRVDASCVQINRPLLADYPEPTLIDALIETWTELGWPRGDFSRTTWQQVARLIQTEESDTHVLNLPGNIRAERHATQVTLSRPVAP